MLNPNQSNRPILNRIQTEKIEVAFDLITEVKEQVKSKNSYTATLLDIAANHCNLVINDDLPEGYQKPERIKVVVKYEPTTEERILRVLSWVVGTSFVTSALCACLSLGAFGISEFKIASGVKDSNNYAAECRGYRGLCYTFLAIALTGSVLGSVIGNAVNGENE